MQSRIREFSQIRIIAAIVIAFVFQSIATGAEAATHVDQVLPTLCKSTQRSYLGDNTEYDGTAIGVRPSSSLWDFDIVVCPINRFRPGDEVEEIRIFTEGDRATSGWCQLYQAPNHDTQVGFAYPRSLGTNRGVASFTPPSSTARNGMLAVTARCLLYPGNSITSIDLIWDL